MDCLRKFLSERGVPHAAAKKDDLVRKCLLAQELELPVAPSSEKRDEEIQNRRTEKLKVDSICIPLPERISQGWIKGSSCFPNVVTASLEVYSRKSTSFKALNEGLNLYHANHIKNVEFNNISDCVRFCFIRGSCVPQTRVNEVPYVVWVCINTQSGDVLTGECNCVAGYSEACKHVFGLLQFIVAEVSLGHNKTCTSIQQQWGQRKSKKNEKMHPPSRLNKINFKRPHPEYESGFVKSSRLSFDPRPPQDRVPAIDWNRLSQATAGKASVLCFKKIYQPNFDHGYASKAPDSTQPKTVDELVIASSHSRYSFLQFLKNNRPVEILDKITSMTQGQSSNPSWFAFRTGVVTASIAHRVWRCDGTAKSTNQIIAKVLGYTKNPKSAALSWGISKEAVARKRFVRQARKNHKQFQCFESGLKLHHEKPFIGASVDGLISCACCGFGNLEIKCPFTHREKSISEYAEVSDTCITAAPQNPSKYEIRRGHPYYTQVQHQMFVTGAKYADFVVFLPKESCIIRVLYDPNFVGSLIPHLEKFYVDSVIPELHNRELIHAYLAKDVLDDLVFNVTLNVTADSTQKQLDRLVIADGKSSLATLPKM